MQFKIDAYHVYRKLKDKYPVVVVQITQDELSFTGTHLAYKDHRDFLRHKFKQQGVEVYRWQHDYESLFTSNPLLGLVYLAGDSVLQETLEVHALIGHNARYVETT